MTGAEYIAAFLARVGSNQVFVLNGGACAFMVDAVDRHPELSCVPFQHEQSAAMAADAVWRVSGKVGVTMATSGPGATNLITGIACSYFDSIPSLHITGQVNQSESTSVHGANVRQSGFQETRIVEMVRPVTKRATLVRTVEELRSELARAYVEATTGRMGPVLIDVPMDVQQARIGGDLLLPPAGGSSGPDLEGVGARLDEFLSKARRPVVLWGAGVDRAGSAAPLAAWLLRHQLPFVASWGGLSAFSHDHPSYVGQIGVYGNRGANFVLQNSDAVVVLGSRLDNRQRSGNPANFAAGADVFVVDVDREELRKYGDSRYQTAALNLAHLPTLLSRVSPGELDPEWNEYVGDMRRRYLGRETSSSARRLNTLCPYDVVRRLSEVVDEDAIVVGDTGAAICWLHQAFRVGRHRLFTAGGNSPMGYALPAAIGAKLASPGAQVISYNGDGGFQLNIQELQTLKLQALDVAVVVMNNSGYGIIAQFQDSYCDGRHSASQSGCTPPNLGAIAAAYGLRYIRVERLEQLEHSVFAGGPIIIDIAISQQTLIEPKLEMGRAINDQYPYLDDDEFAKANRFVYYPRIRQA